MVTQATALREDGDLLEIVAANDYRRLIASDYLKLIALRDHYSRSLEQVQAAIAACPALWVYESTPA